MLTDLRERREHKVFQELLKLVPGLEERLMTGSDDEVAITSDLVSLQSQFREYKMIIPLVDPKRRLRRSRR